MNERQAAQQKAELDQQVLQNIENFNKVTQYFIIIKYIKTLKTKQNNKIANFFKRIKWNF